MNAMSAATTPLTPPTPGPQAAPRGDGARGAAFARCLDRACAADPPAEPDVEDAGESRDAAERSAAPPRAAAKARDGRDVAAARKAEAAEANEAAPAEPDAGQATDGSDATRTDGADAPRGEAAAPDLAALLPGWSAPLIVAAGAQPGSVEGDVAENLHVSAAASGASPALAAPPKETGARAAPALETPPRAAAPAGDAAPTSAAQLQAASPTLEDKTRVSPGATPTTAAAVTFSALPAASPAAEPAPQTMTSATLQAAINTTAFAPSLATQVRWWANDGVQQAQLLLNPAEMGPVAVKIALDGREARIDFSADLAATRSAIEAALPALAAALDDSGLKLCGGGVHDGAAQRQPAWGAHSVTHRTAPGTSVHDDERAVDAAARRGTTGRGLVDLVA